jgi:hypothetical protein
MAIEGRGGEGRNPSPDFNRKYTALASRVAHSLRNLYVLHFSLIPDTYTVRCSFLHGCETWSLILRDDQTEDVREEGA